MRSRNHLTIAIVVGILLIVYILGGAAILDSLRPAAPAVVAFSEGALMVMPTATPGMVPTPYGQVRSHKLEGVLLWKRTVSRLETKEYEIVQDVPIARLPAWTLLGLSVGSESVQVHLVGIVIGRTDLSRLMIDPDMRTGDLTISDDGESIAIVLPFPELSHPIIDEERSGFNNYQLGWFSESDPSLWQQGRHEASDAIVQKACEMGILEAAREEAERQITALFRLSFRNVFVQTRPATTWCGATASGRPL